MQKPKNLKVGDQFRVIVGNEYFRVGEIITLEKDYGTDNPYFWKESRCDYWSINFSKLEPYPKTIRDAQVGDVVVVLVGKNRGSEHLVLERLQNTVLLSYADDFKIAGNIFTFDELEEYFTLKDAPLTMTAEQVRDVLKEYLTKKD